MNESLWLWAGFNLFVLLMIAIDLFLLHRNKAQISIMHALFTSLLWIGLALLFNLGIYFYRGPEPALNFFTAYLIEEFLSIDNLFVFLMLFQYFHTPPQYQRKVLFWGILGAIFMRAFFIFFGIALVNSFHWILYLFGIFLIFAGIKMASPKIDQPHPENNMILKFLKRWIPISTDDHADKFFIKNLNSWKATPLFIVLILVETTDFIFALDSIPAVLAITRDPFIVYTSNIFAILGLRSLYFALSGLMPLFHLLNYGLAIILVFVGLKMLLEPLIVLPTLFVLAFVAIIIASTVLASYYYSNKGSNIRKK